MIESPTCCLPVADCIASAARNKQKLQVMVSLPLASAGSPEGVYLGPTVPARRKQDGNCYRDGHGRSVTDCV